MPEKRRHGTTYHLRFTADQAARLDTIARVRDLPISHIWRVLVNEEHERLLTRYGPAIEDAVAVPPAGEAANER